MISYAKIKFSVTKDEFLVLFQNKNIKKLCFKKGEKDEKVCFDIVVALSYLCL